jgi:hypothetical protein
MPSQKQNRYPPKRPLSDRSDEETNAQESRPQPLVTIEACDPALTIWCRCVAYHRQHRPSRPAEFKKPVAVVIGVGHI